MAALAVVIALYLRRLSSKEKQAALSRLHADTLAATPDEALVDAVIRDMLASCEQAQQHARLPWTAPDMYRMVAKWSNPQVNVYAVWVAVKETENGSALHYLTFRGFFCPLSFIIILSICVSISLLIPPMLLGTIEQILRGFFIALSWATIHTLMEITLPRSQDGYDALMSLMDDPIAPFRDE